MEQARATVGRETDGQDDTIAARPEQGRGVSAGQLEVVAEAHRAVLDCEAALAEARQVQAEAIGSVDGAISNYAIAKAAGLSQPAVARIRAKSRA